jgi:hypothetical protein
MARLTHAVAFASLFPLLAAAALGPGRLDAAPTLTAAQIVEKNVAARGGLQAWRNVQTMVWSGHMESARAAVPGMRFELVQQRPNRTRFEIDARGEHSLRLFDGARGWKVMPTRGGGKPEVRPYEPQELKFAQEAPGIDGPLVDYEAKGNTVSLEGMDDVDGHKAYRLSVQLNTGEARHIWIDAQSFLEIKYDRPSYTRKGQAGTVTVFYRDYKSVDGLKLPSIIETGVGTGEPDRMVIEKFQVNAPLDERLFARPGSLPATPTAQGMNQHAGGSREPRGSRAAGVVAGQSVAGDQAAPATPSGAPARQAVTSAPTAAVPSATPVSQ